MGRKVPRPVSDISSVRAHEARHTLRPAGSRLRECRIALPQQKAVGGREGGAELGWGQATEWPVPTLRDPARSHGCGRAGALTVTARPQVGYRGPEDGAGDDVARVMDAEIGPTHRDAPPRGTAPTPAPAAGMPGGRERRRGMRARERGRVTTGVRGGRPSRSGRRRRTMNLIAWFRPRSRRRCRLRGAIDAGARRRARRARRRARVRASKQRARRR